MPKHSRHDERIADLEQSEALLRCKIINLEEQLAAAQQQQATKELQNKDLGEHCKKLEDSLAILDAEKSLLDELKRENGNLRNKLASSENETASLVDKMAKMAEDNASLETKLSRVNKSDSALQETLKKSGDEISTLKTECTALSDRCSALEVVKTCLTEQIRAMEEEISNETSEANEKVKKLNQKIRSLQSEKSDLTEYKEKYESEQELNANMTEKLTKRISDLQDHIETLKSQLDNQKHKVASFDKLQEQLELALSEKCALEAANQRQRAETQKLEDKLSDQQEQLSDSFERANMQLMLETNEMATRQRSLLAEVQALRVKSSVRGVEARIGSELRQRLKGVADSCREIMRSIRASGPTVPTRGVSPVPTLALGDLAATPRPPTVADFWFDVELTELSDREIEEMVTEMAKSVEGLNAQELFELQAESPRMDGVGGLDNLKRDAKESHVIAETLTCAMNVFSDLCSKMVDSQSKINDLVNENAELRRPREYGEDNNVQLEQETVKEAKRLSEDLRIAKKSLEDANTQLYQTAQDNEKIKSRLQEFEDKCSTLAVDNKALQDDLNLSKQVEEELKAQLSDTQATCDQLVSRMQKVQEEKAELIMAQQQQEAANTSQSEIESLRENLNRLQAENAKLRGSLKEEKAKSETEISNRLDEIESLRAKLEEAQRSEFEIRKSLDETQSAGEELIKRVQTIQEEKFEILEKNKAETEELKAALSTNDELLRKAQEENGRLEENIHKLVKDVESLQESNENQVEMLLANDATIADLQHSLEQAEREIAELNSRIEAMRKDAEAAAEMEVDRLKEKEKSLSKQLEEANEKAETQQRIHDQLQGEVEQSRDAFLLYKEQTEATKTALQQEIETLRDSNEQLNKEADLANAKVDKATKQTNAMESSADERVEMLEQDLQSQTQKTVELEEALVTAQQKVEKLSEELNSRLMEFAELQTNYDDITRKLEESETESRSLERIVEKLRSPNLEEEGEEEEETKPEVGPTKTEVETLEQELREAQSQIQNTELRIQDLEGENASLQDELNRLQQLANDLRHEPRDQAIQCSMRRDDEAVDKLSTSDYPSNAFTGEVEWAAQRCSSDEGDAAERRGKQLSIATNAPARTSSFAQASDLSGSDKTMENLIDFDSEVEGVAEEPTPRAPAFSSSEQASSASVGNLSATESNQLLLEPTAVQSVEPYEVNQPLEAAEDAMARFGEDGYVQKLRAENERLSAMLRVAQEKANGKETLQEQVGEYQQVVSELRTKLNEAESHIQSGTESDPEAILQERRTRQEEDKREIERLSAQLLDADCTVVACKNKIEYEQKVINDLRVAIERLHTECDDYKRKLKLPDHPAIDNALLHLKQKRLTTSSPAALASEKASLRETPGGSMCEMETLPFDEVIAYLCDNCAEGREEIERLTTELEDSKDLLHSLKRRNQELEREALDLEEKLQETNRNLAVKEDERCEMQKLLTMNEANSKESLRSKEEDIEKLEERIQSLNFDVEEKSQQVCRLQEKRETTAVEHEAEISRMKKKMLDLTAELDKQVEEKDILATETRDLQRTNRETKLLLEKKDKELQTIKEEDHDKQESLRESLQSLQDKYEEKCESELALNKTLHFWQVEIDKLKQAAKIYEETENHLKVSLQQTEQNVSSLSNELSDRDERIEVLSSRLDELAETEGALRSTMESADDMIAEREQRHQEEVEELKDGLNKSLSEANRAKMSSEELQEEIVLLEKKNEALENEIDEIRKEGRDVASEMETMEMERELMNTSLINAREETQEAQDRNEDLAHTVGDLNETVDQMQATIDSLNAQVVALRNECDQLTSDAQQKDSEATRLIEENNALVDKLRGIELAAATNTRGASVEKPAVKSEQTERLEEEIGLLREGLAQAQKLIHSLRIDKEHLEQEVTRMQTDSARGSLQWTDTAADENACDVSDRDVSLSRSEDDRRMEDAKEDSPSLRSENEALRSKIASLEDSLNEMTGRLVPKLELGSIAESETKQHNNDDDTGRYLDDCDVDTARVIQHGGAEVESLREKLRASEDAAAKLLLQVQEMEEESGSLRERVQELAKQNDDMQKEFFGAIHENFQGQIDELSASNAKLQEELASKVKELEDTKAQMQNSSGSENQWRQRYQEVQKLAEELRARLQRTEEDNHDLQCRLIDLDQECQRMMNQGPSEQPTSVLTPNDASVEAGEMKPKTCDACAQTLSLDDVIREVREERRARKRRQIATNGIDDTENEVSDIDSRSSGSAPNLAAELLAIPEVLGGATEVDGLANDPLLQRSIIREKVAPDEEKFDEANIPPPVTQNGEAGGLRTPDSEPPSISIATKLGVTLGDQIKSLQSEIVGYQLMIEKLKKRNQELLDGAGAAMTQDDKEAMEREISALRGQVALLERNNKIFSDRERTELKQAEKLREQLREFEEGEKSASSSQSGDSNQEEKYARLLELEEEAEDLKNRIKEKEEDVKDRDVMVEELQHQLENVKKQHREEARKLEKKNKERENEMMEEIRDLEKQVEDCQEMIELKQTNLKSKCNELEESEYEIENLQKEVQKKNKEIEKLKWDIESLQRENAALRERIDNLRQALSEVNALPMSPPTSFRSPSNTSMQFRSRPSSRTSNPVTSPKRHSELSSRSADSIESASDHVRGTSPADDDSDGRRMRSPLRSGIESAKRKVHDMGDVLDTPRAAPTPRSSTSKNPTSGRRDHGPDMEDAGTDAVPLQKHNDEDGASSSSSSSSDESSSVRETRPGSLSLSSHQLTPAGTENRGDPAVKQTRSGLGEGTSAPEVPSGKGKFGSKTIQGYAPPEQHFSGSSGNRLESSQDRDPIKEDIVSVLSLPSNNATLETSFPTAQSGLSATGEGITTDDAFAAQPLPKSSSGARKSEDEAFSSSESSSSTFQQSLPSANIRLKSEGDKKGTTPSTTNHLSSTPSAHTKPEAETDNTRQQVFPGTQASPTSNRLSLLPDDRPTLIQEVAKARDEARKWFEEVTQSDREKRNMSRRLTELESELERLKGIEDNYSALKKKQAEVDHVTRDLEMLREQTAAANRKVEEARERSALLQAHLLDKEQVEAENAKLKENIEALKQDGGERKSSTPLRELQPSSLNSSISDLQTSPERKMSDKDAPHDVAPGPEIESQLRSIRDSFEYVANNFTSLVLKKHDAELALSPEKAKVSKLKRKCLERDQLLAKLVLKLRKKKHHDVSDDDSSVTSSLGLDNMLARADSLIRSEVIDSDWSEPDHVLPASRKDEIGKGNEFITSPRPSSELIRSLTEKPIKRPHASPTHRIFVAKRDYAPSARTDEDPTAPVTHALLPDLPVLAGDTVVAIGNPDKRGDGKMYQLAEVRGKIGFVPLAHLVAAEQVEGMQAFVQEKSKKRKSPSSSPEKIVDLYKKLEQAHLLVADKIERASKTSKSSLGSRSLDSVASEGKVGASPDRSYDEIRRNRGESWGDDLSLVVGSLAADTPGHQARRAGARPSEASGIDSSESVSKRHLDRSRKGSGRSSNRSLSPVLPVARDYDSEVRSSTPRFSPEKQARRSSSLPPRRDRPDALTPPKRADRRQRRDRNASRESGVERTLAPPRVLSSPKSPTFVVIEKTMGQKSMIVSWTPPVLDMISRSNGIPVIGYEISIDGERRVQISGAYTNKAILGDLDLSRNLLVEVRTVSSVGTLSRPAEVVYSPNSDVSAHSDHATPFEVSQTSVAQQSIKSGPASPFASPIRRATALYDYDPAVDSPYKSHEEEVGLNKGSSVLVLGSPRPDGFCDVQVGNKRGLAPIAFLVSEDDGTDSSSVTSSTRHSKPRSSRPRTKGKRQQR